MSDKMLWCTMLVMQGKHAPYMDHDALKLLKMNCLGCQRNQVNHLMYSLFAYQENDKNNYHHNDFLMVCFLFQVRCREWHGMGGLSIESHNEKWK